MPSYSPVLADLIDKFRALPGIGTKSAVRLAFHVLNMTEEEVADFARALTEAKSKLGLCSVCSNISDSERCGVCGDSSRDPGIICVVENPRDVPSFERIKEYTGVYHVLHGVISPLDGIGPDDLKIRELLARAAGGSVKEMIVATGSTVEGEATAMYIAKLVKPLGVTVSRIAYGMPVGGELEYADEMTLFKALEGRREM